MNSRKQLYRRLSELFRIFQKRTFFVGSAYDTSLTLAESHVLVEVDGDPGISQKDLVPLLLLPKSSLSRIVRKLIKQGLLSSHSESGSRIQKLKVTAHGLKLLRRFDSLANAPLESFSSHISQHEREHFEACIKKIADYWEVPLSTRRKSDHFLRPTIRRVTRQFGLVSSKIPGADISPLHWHILAEVHGDSKRRFAKELCETFHVPSNTMSQSLHALERDGLILRQSIKTDRRSVLLKLTKKGESLLEQVEKHRTGLLEAPLSKLKSQEIDSFISILERMIGETGLGISLEGSGLSLQPIATETSMQEARRFLVRKLYREIENGNTPYIPVRIFDPASRSFSLLKAQEIVAICEVQYEIKQYVLRNVAFDEGLVSEATLCFFLLDSISRVLREEHVPRVLLDAGDYVNNVLSQDSKSYHGKGLCVANGGLRIQRKFLLH